MATQKNHKSLLSRAKNIMRKNDEFMSQINMNNSELPFSKVMNGGFNSEKMLNRLVKTGSDNYKNLKSKVPVLGKNGEPIEFKINGKTFFRLYKPDFNDSYSPKKGFGDIYIHPDDVKHFSSGKQKLLTRRRNGTQKAGDATSTTLIVLGVISAVIMLFRKW
jgi:hypothetical protein